MVQGALDPAGDRCHHCGSALRMNAPFCGSCGQAVLNRSIQPATQVTAPRPIAPLPPAGQSDRIVGAGRGVRCASYLLDLAVMLSPALPLAIAAAILGVPEIVYIVVPIAFVAVWAWMQIWQGYTGMTYGRSMLGLRLTRVSDHKPPGLTACVTRSGVFAATAGLAALPVVASDVPRDGWHDKLTELTVIDTVQGGNPLGRKQEPVFRRSPDRGLNKVAAPLPVNMSRRG